MAAFQLTGKVCAVDTECVNAVGAILTAGAVVLLIVHTRQITRSVGLAVVVAIMWLLSPLVLGISIWQSARFDMLAFIGAIAAGVLWWKVFGQRILSRGAMVLAVVASILTMAFAFNAKETMYYHTPERFREEESLLEVPRPRVEDHPPGFGPYEEVVGQHK